MTTLAERFTSELLDDLQHKRLLLPTLPEVALKIREVTDDPDASMHDLSTIIASDPALSARLIQIANSPLLRTGRQVDNIESAVNRLGMRMIHDLVTSIVMQQMFQATSDATDKRLHQLWEHSTEVAALCHVLAAQFTQLNPEQALLAGLIHKIGALPVLTKAEDYPELVADEKALDEIIRLLHPRIGGAILRSWHFSQELIDVAELHENPQRNSEATDLTDLVIVAKLQTQDGAQDYSLSGHKLDDVPALSKLGFDSEISFIEMEGVGDDIRQAQLLLSA